MAQKPNNNQKFPRNTRKNETWNSAMTILLAGCAAEAYLLLIRRFYIYGNVDQVLGWDSGLRIAIYAGLAVLAAGAILLLTSRDRARMRLPGWILLGAGAFAALAGWISITFYATAVGFLCVAVPAAMLLGILWSLYDRECAWALTILGGDLMALWLCRRGLRSEVWHLPILIGAVAAIALCAAAVAVFYRADRNHGMVGKLRLLPAKGDPLVIYIACGVSAVTIAAAIFSVALAYYAMWAVAVLVFAVAAYYTVRQL
ncbi:MAG: hypothetical protein LKJ80_02455 [Oscillibacter sp.]|jgi:hypothetical protein|nr:hypothetical protein [Oscillibacter sp.]